MLRRLSVENYALIDKLEMELDPHLNIITGETGAGKTTLLEQLAPRLRQRGFTPLLFRVTAETSTAERVSIINRVRTMRAPDFLLLDGAEQFSTREWLTLYSAASPLAGCSSCSSP